MPAVDPLIHHPVMLEAVIEALNIRSNGVYVDATYGRGGHAQAIMQRLGEQGRLIAIDRDSQAIESARKRWANDGRVTIRQGAFAMLESYVQEQGLAGRVNGVLLDLGVSSPQLDDALRGFSFMHDGPLDMRMDRDAGRSAAEWLEAATEAEIADVFHKFGEERYARRIARAIVTARQEQAITSTRRLAEIIAAANPAWERDKHPATRSFQAIRIFINHELEELESCLPQAVSVLAPGGRLVVISFHSLEDRIVKRFMRRQARGGEFPPDMPVPSSAFKPALRLIGKSSRADEDEVADNPRARSAVLRVAEKV